MRALHLTPYIPTKRYTLVQQFLFLIAHKFFALSDLGLKPTDKQLTETLRYRIFFAASQCSIVQLTDTRQKIRPQ